MPEMKTFSQKQQGPVTPYATTALLQAQTARKQVRTATTCQNQQNECAPSKDSYQPGHPPSLIRVFAVHSVGS